ncbi:MAG: hypothetical protein V3V46_08680 [Anaerolineales bacterium]
MAGSRRSAFFLVILLLLIAILSCTLTQGGSEGGDEPPEDPTPTAAAASTFPEEDVTVSEPGGAILTVAAGALSDDAEVAVENIGEGVPFASGSPFSAASPEYMVELGDANQVGSILMSVPLNVGAKQAAGNPSYVYLAWTEPTGGTPSVVGVLVEEDTAIFPIVGKGKYQVFKLIAHESLVDLISLYDPLAVPTYPQRTPAWCSPTAMTNVVNYHQGGWPVGGFGAVWGESSNWFLAGKAGQPFNSGYFFHWLLGAGGYTVPSDVKQSFSDGNAEVIIWNWKAAVYFGFDPQSMTFGFHTDYDFADALFDAYQAYVESFVWGVNGPRRPVAWGSSLAGHSRTITGSNGTDYYYNDPGSGSLNSTRSWADYRQTVMDSFTGPKIEVIDTVVFYAEPRPANARRGVIWLLPRRDDGFAGSVALIAGDTGMPATNWQWDGDLGHENGYYHEDLRGILPTDPVFDSKFEAMDYNDEVEYGFAVFNISSVTYDYHVDIVLQNENFSVLENVGKFDVSVAPGSRANLFPADSFRLFDLPPGLFTLKFVLLQGGVYQDVKYVQFRVAESDLMVLNPQGVLIQNAFCRKGPDPVFDDVTAFAAGTELDLVGVNSERTWGKFEALINEITFQCWISLPAVEVTGEENAPVLVSPLLPEPAGPVCVSTLDRSACNEAGGTFVLGTTPFCQCPE